MKQVVVLKETYKDDICEEKFFDSVSACAVYFAHEARRQYANNPLTKLEGDELFDAVAQDLAVLFAGIDCVTPKDPEEVHGGDDNSVYSAELRSVSDLAKAKSDAKMKDLHCE